MVHHVLQEGARIQLRLKSVLDHRLLEARQLQEYARWLAVPASYGMCLARLGDHRLRLLVPDQ